MYRGSATPPDGKDLLFALAVAASFAAILFAAAAVAILVP
jgi:hypothetical protein